MHMHASEVITHNRDLLAYQVRQIRLTDTLRLEDQLRYNLSQTTQIILASVGPASST